MIAHTWVRCLFVRHTILLTNPGNVIGSLESWLLLRSLRTLHLRVSRQSETATQLVAWFASLQAIPEGQKSEDGVPGGLITKVWHSSLQTKESGGFDASKQMEGGFNATFSIQVSLPYTRSCMVALNVTPQTCSFLLLSLLPGFRTF